MSVQLRGVEGTFAVVAATRAALPTSPAELARRIDYGNLAYCARDHKNVVKAGWRGATGCLRPPGEKVRDLLHETLGA
jgi:hypothetical protein